MLSRNFMLVGGMDNFFFHYETLEYAYPFSLARVTYNNKDEKPKVFHLKIGYPAGGGELSYRSKKELSKKAQEYLAKYCRGLKPISSRYIKFSGERI